MREEGDRERELKRVGERKKRHRDTKKTKSTLSRIDKVKK